MCFQVMDAESGELFISGDGGMAPDSWQLDAPFSCSDLVFGGSEKPLREWAVDPDCVSLRPSVCLIRLIVQERSPDAVKPS